MFFTDHLYFSGALFIFVFLWLPFFIFNKEGRKWMLRMSLFGAIMALPFVQNMYIADWWRPNFIFDSAIKIEDVLFGFGTVGVISSIYSLLKARDKRLAQIHISPSYKIAAIFSAFVGFFVPFYIFGIHSLWSSAIGVVIGVTFLMIKKPTFLKHATLTGFLVCAGFLPIYLMALYINPEFITNEWLLHNLSGTSLWTVPIEEFIWYFFAALGTSGLQEALS